MQPNAQAKQLLTAQSSPGTWYCILSRFNILIGQCADEQHSGEHISGHLPIQSLFVMLAGLQGSYMHGWNGCPKCGRRILRTCTTPPRTRLWTKDIHRFSSTVELGEASFWYSNGRTSDIKQDWYEAHADQDLARPSHRWPECIIQPISSKSLLKSVFAIFWYEEEVWDPMFVCKVCSTHHYLQFEHNKKSLQQNSFFHIRMPDPRQKTRVSNPWNSSKKSEKKSQGFSHLEEPKLTWGAMIFKKSEKNEPP